MPRFAAMQFARAATLRLLWRASAEHWDVFSLASNTIDDRDGFGRPWPTGPAPLP